MKYLIRFALWLGKLLHDSEKDPVKRHRIAKDIWEFKKDIEPRNKKP